MLFQIVVKLENGRNVYMWGFRSMLFQIVVKLIQYN